ERIWWHEDRSAGGQGSAGPNGLHAAAVHAQGAGLSRPDPEAELPYQNCVVRRIKYGTKNQSNRSANRGQPRLALQVVRRQEGIRQTADRRPPDSGAAEEEARVRIRAADPDRAGSQPL